jgi:hypothetical protein
MSISAVESTADRLAVEVERYLAAVEAFRTEGCQPVWRAEPSGQAPPAELPRPNERSFRW